jgi:hypothetical protein
VIVPTPQPIELKRHYHTLSEKETQGVVEAVAELIVTFLKGKRQAAQPEKTTQEQTHERDHEPDAGAR